MRHMPSFVNSITMKDIFIPLEANPVILKVHLINCGYNYLLIVLIN